MTRLKNISENKASKSVAVIVSTYNWPEALEIVLKSLNAQSCPPNEIIIADDGSDTRTAQMIKAVMKPTNLAWCHIRQKNLGFRQARLRNLGLRFSTSEYLIFIDHDTVVHHKFVADHLQFSESNMFLLGKRVFLSPELTNRILSVPQKIFSPPSFWAKNLGNRKNAIRAPKIGKLLMRHRKFQKTLRGSNLSVHRNDFLRVDGFDELFDGVWGREDSDLCYRLFHSGIKCKNLWFTALQYHLHHPTSSKRRERDHLDEELELVRSQRRKKAIRGYSKMDEDGSIISTSENNITRIST